MNRLIFKKWNHVTLNSRFKRYIEDAARNHIVLRAINGCGSFCVVQSFHECCTVSLFWSFDFSFFIIYPKDTMKWSRIINIVYKYIHKNINQFNCAYYIEIEKKYIYTYKVNGRSIWQCQKFNLVPFNETSFNERKRFHCI